MHSHTSWCCAAEAYTSSHADSLKKEYGVTITPQAVEAYNPIKYAGRNLAKRWRELFEATRKEFLEKASDVPIANRSVRLRTPQRMIEAAEQSKNFGLVAQLLEQAANEVGDSYTNKRQVSGPNGGAIPVQAITAQMSPQEAAAAYAQTLNGGP